MNDQHYYQKSPAAQYSTRNGSLSPERYKSRTFNRRLKMRDTFTQIFPSYEHQPLTCFTQASSHILHPKHPKKDDDKEYNHKMDPIKVYSESMYKLGVFAPQPIKSPKIK